MNPKQKTTHPYLKRIGEHIKQLRVQQNLSLEAVGSSIGIDGSNMQKIENGMNITMSSLVRILIVLKKNPAQFFTGLAWDLTEDDIEAFTVPRVIKKKIKKRKK